MRAGSLPPSLALLNSLVVLDLHSNGLSGSLGEFAFQVQANRADLHSSLRYLDLGNNSLSGEAFVGLVTRFRVFGRLQASRANLHFLAALPRPGQQLPQRWGSTYQECLQF